MARNHLELLFKDNFDAQNANKLTFLIGVPGVAPLVLKEIRKKYKEKKLLSSRLNSAKI